jgi:hypothetical protein
MIDLQKKIAEIDRQLAENQRRHQHIEYVEWPIWILVATVMITGAAIFAAGMWWGNGYDDRYALVCDQHETPVQLDLLLDR